MLNIEIFFWYLHSLGFFLQLLNPTSSASYRWAIKIVFRFFLFFGEKLPSIVQLIVLYYVVTMLSFNVYYKCAYDHWVISLISFCNHRSKLTRTVTFYVKQRLRKFQGPSCSEINLNNFSFVSFFSYMEFLSNIFVHCAHAVTKTKKNKG